MQQGWLILLGTASKKQAEEYSFSFIQDSAARKLHAGL